MTKPTEKSLVDLLSSINNAACAVLLFFYFVSNEIFEGGGLAFFRTGVILCFCIGTAFAAWHLISFLVRVLTGKARGVISDRAKN